MKHVYFLILPNTHILDLAGPLQIVTTIKELGIADVNVECIGPQSTVQTFQRLTLSDVHPLPARLRADSALFVIGSKLDSASMGSVVWKETAIWLRDRAIEAGCGMTICGVCTGSFLLADAGLLDGRLCTTHHNFIQQLRRVRPAINVVENRVCVQDRNIWTSAGVTSGVDLALQVVASAFGNQAAIQVARENVVNFRRFGADPELSASMRYRSHCNSRIHAVQDAIAKDLSLRLTCNDLAQLVNYSARHLSRVFAGETGVTIQQFQTELRMELARELLTGSALSLEGIAEQCGFGSVQALRANWNKREASPPSALRTGQARAAA